jgi:hypothetical protein
MAYELNAEGANGVSDTTTVVAITPFNLPQAPPNSTGQPPPKAIWVVDASPLAADFPSVGPVDGIWGTGGSGGGNGIIGYTAWDGKGGIGVCGNSDNIGVYGYGANAVVGVSQAASGIAILGKSFGTGVVGWAGNIPQPFEGGAPSSIGFPSGEKVGVYGCIGDALTPSPANNLPAGVWGDAGTSDSGAGVVGTSNNGAGGVFQSNNWAQVSLVPSTTPLDQTKLMESGQPGDLYLFSVSKEVGTTGTFDIATMLWLCIAPAAGAGTQAMWAQVQLGDTVGG